MTITPADSLDLLIARGPPDATDFAKQIAGLPGAYYAGLDEAYKRRNQDAFAGGLPMKNGQVDLPTAYDTIARLGGTEKALPVIQSMNQQAADNVIAGVQSGGGGYFPNAPGSGISGAPPSTAPASFAPPRIPSDGTGQSITGIVTSSGFTGTAADNLARALSARYKVDQTQQLSPEQFSAAQQYTQQVAGARQPAQQPQQTAQVQPAAPGFNPQAPAAAAAPTTDPTAGGLVPQAWIARGGTPQTFRDLQAAIQNGSASPGMKAAALERQKALDQYFAKNAELTPLEKELRSSGRPGEDIPTYEARKAATKTRDEGIQGIANEGLKTAMTGYAAAQDSGQSLDTIKQSIDALGPTGWMGANAVQRMAVARTLNSVADSLLPKSVADTVKFDPAKLATAEDFVKQSQRLTFAVARTLGPREAVQIVQQAGSSVPNIEQSPLGAKVVWSSLNQARQRAVDLGEYMSRPENAGRLRAEIDFNKQNPPEKYSIRAVYDAGLPLHINDQEDGARQKYNLAPGGMVIIDQNGNRWTKPKAG
jgi:hypothetical protein